MLEELKTGSTVVGLKQLRKVLKDGTVQKVFLARNAEPRLVEPIEALCREKNVPCIWVDTMAQLGTACGIDVWAPRPRHCCEPSNFWSQRNILGYFGIKY